MLVAGVLWLASGGSFQKKMDTYVAIVEESVAGLNVNAPVKYNGVDIGKVQNIRLDPVNPQRVQLLLSIDQGSPIKVDTIAVLKTQGLTGIAYIELDGGAKNAEPLVAKGNQRYPVIQTKPSLSTRLETVLTTVLAKLDSTSNNVDSVFSQENQQALKKTLASVATITETIAARKKELDAGIVNASRTADNIARATQKLNPILDAIPPLANQLKTTIVSINKSAIAIEKAGNAAETASTQAGHSVESVSQNINAYAQDTLPELQRLMGELNELSSALLSLVEQTERDPASLLRGRSPTQNGPGETSNNQ